MEVFDHHIYEFKKGLRNLILHTTNSDQEKIIINKLKKENISHVIYHISSEKINVFIGNNLCIDIIKRINKPMLYELTDEEDFMLGMMLGYGMIHQCERYLKRRNKREDVEDFIS